MKTFESLNSLF